MSFYATLTPEERGRMHPCRREKCVMMSRDSPPPLQTSAVPSGYDMPDDVRPGKNSPTTTVTLKSLRLDCESYEIQEHAGNGALARGEGGVVIEEIMPIVQKLPLEETDATIEKNGGTKPYENNTTKTSSPSSTTTTMNNGLKAATFNDLEDDPCLIKCIYYTQQCCECTIV